jgi:hypothetical protein
MLTLLRELGVLCERSDSEARSARFPDTEFHTEYTKFTEQTNA